MFTGHIWRYISENSWSKIKIILSTHVNNQPQKFHCDLCLLKYEFTIKISGNWQFKTKFWARNLLFSYLLFFLTLSNFPMMRDEARRSQDMRVRRHWLVNMRRGETSGRLMCKPSAASTLWALKFHGWAHDRVCSSAGNKLPSEGQTCGQNRWKVGSNEGFKSPKRGQELSVFAPDGWVIPG